MIAMAKQDGAFLTIGELAAELGVPHHILRYWESRFPALRPLQRAGNRRYYRPEDVELARAIHRLLNVEGYTVKGAQQALSAKGAPQRASDAPPPDREEDGPVSATDIDAEAMPGPALVAANAQVLSRLTAIRQKLRTALDIEG